MEIPVGSGSSSFRAVIDQTVAPYLWRPWYDGVLTSAVSKVFFPLSRAWAVAAQARGDLTVFNTIIGERIMVGRRLLESVDRARQTYDTALAEWEAGFFGDATVDPKQLAGLNQARISASRKYMALRVGFLAGHMEQAFPAVDFQIEPEARVAVRHGSRLEDPTAAMVPDLSVSVRESRSFQQGDASCHWVRFPAPAGCVGDDAEARVREPLNKPPRATIIFAHGIGMEPEMWGEQGTIPDWFLAQGCRVIEPQGPWHARRRPEGFYGGEAILARGPGGLLDYSWTHVRELGRLIAYARDLDCARGREPAPVLTGGISLGALTTMQLLTWSAHWPATMRPDHGLLIAPAASLIEVAYRGSLTGSMGVSDALQQSGWTEGRVARWAPLLNAGTVSGIDPSRIIAVLGDVDAVTPFASGEKLARDWALPDENIWVRNQGHFTVSLGLTSAPDPLHRVLELI